MRSFLLALVLALPALTLGAGLVPISNFDLAPAAGNQLSPAIAEGRDGFLATWIDARNPFQGNLRATRLDPQGKVLDPSGILLESDDLDDSISITAHRAFWTGSSWLVLYLHGDALMKVVVAADGSIQQTPLALSSGANTPHGTFDAIAMGDRIVVTGPATNGASMIVLDTSGTLVAGPTIVEKSTSQRPVRSVLAAPLGNFVLVADLSWYACSTCPTIVVHKMSLGAVELARTTPPGIDDKPRAYAISQVGNGFLLVGQDTGARVESWRLSSSLDTIDLHEVISSPAKFGFQGSLLLRTSLGHGDFFYFAPNEAQGPALLHRAEIASDGKATIVPFDVADANAGQFDVVVGAGGTIAVMTRMAAASDIDVVTRAAQGIDSLPQAASHDLTFTAPVQNQARATRRGQETLVSWVEQHHGEAATDLYVTRLDAAGRPIPVLPVRLMDGATPYAIATNGNDYLVARSQDSTISVRRLAANLSWIDLTWVTVGTQGCGELNEHSIVWDGTGWWLGWIGCGINSQVEMRRINRDLFPTTSVVTLQSDNPQPPLLAKVDGAVIAFWLGEPPACPILCPPSLGELRGARVSLSGSVLTSPIGIVDDVQIGLLDFASRGSEILAIWASADNLYSTRITKDLVPLDVAYEGTAVRGKFLENSGLDTIDIGWDGSQWVVAAQTVRYKPDVNRTMSYRRFAPGSDPAVMWNGASIHDLGDPAEGTTLAVSAGTGGSTFVIQTLANESTSGVFRYFSRNMSVASRTRPVRR
ncbi:MAG: hypothetical protein WC538_18315 [Thermoanaerobaculia bacterium]|jgi:hypothetical protein